VVDEAFSTTRPGVFALGDAVSGPATIVEAVAHGNLVAVSVDHWLRTGTLEKPVFQTTRHDVESASDPAEYVAAHRPATPRRSVAEREHDFCEVETGFDEQTAREEAKRCLRCDLEWLDLMKIPRPGCKGQANDAKR
jgi:NADH-quinone oxidoreductase subunit F